MNDPPPPSSLSSAPRQSNRQQQHNRHHYHYEQNSYRSNYETEIYLAKYSTPDISKLEFKLLDLKIFEIDSNNRLQTKIDKLDVDTSYLVRIVQSGHEELVIVRTKALPKVSVIHRNATSITITFEDFKPINDDGYGYEIHYQPNSGFWHLYNQWLIVKSNGQPFYTIAGLKPNTRYKIQVFTWSELDHKQVLHSEIIEATTANGCIFQNRSYELQEKILDDCEQTCHCVDGQINCRKRCLAPYHSIREAQLKNLKCSFPANEQCCVKCNLDDDNKNNAAGDNVEDDHISMDGSETNHHDRPSFSDKPGICPGPHSINKDKKKIDDDGRLNSTNSTGNAADSSTIECQQSSCSHDYHCTGMDKCCENQCGFFHCQSPISRQSKHHLHSEESNREYCPLECDRKTEICKFFQEEYKYRCVARPKPADPNRMKHFCLFQNQQYSIGQSFESDCQICICSEALEVECHHKCPDRSINETSLQQSTSSSSSTTVKCRFINDPNDPLCCRKEICINTTLPNSDSVDLFNRSIENEQKNLKVSAAFDSCRHLNKNYQINETFNVGCELRCFCRPNSEVECFPRCFEDENHYNPDYCHLRPDPDDPECCKISICDFNTTVSEQTILIEMAESINSTSIRFKLIFITGFDEDLSIWYRESNDSKSSLPSSSSRSSLLNKNSDEINWKHRKIINQMVRILSNDSKEIVLTDLKPETDYTIYFKIGTKQSNTVIVRTFPEGIDQSFKGCFHGNQILQIGEIFYEGHCEYKCICKEGGIRDCFERCPLYVDMITSKNCHFIPSEEDECCSIPVCENDFVSENNCVLENGQRYKIGETWTFGSGCEEKICLCSKTNQMNSTEIKCRNSNCPEIPESIMQPTSQCPNPKIIQPEDPCGCPYLICEHNINPLDLPDKSLQKTAKNYCFFKGNQISLGEEFYDDCRAVCSCQKNGSLDCQPIHCGSNFGPHITNCLEWEIDPFFLPKAPNCCPEPKCKNDGSCSFAGIRIPNLKEIPGELLPCNRRCICDHGKIQCRNICPEIPDEPPLGLNCPSSLAFRGHLPGDNCCIHWQCREIYRDKIYGKCVYNDKVYKLGEYWDDEESDVHRRCHCKVTNSILHVVCEPGLCQPITERFLEPTAECRTPTVISPKDAIMCPYVICNNTASKGEEIENIDIMAINATSIRIRFTVPSVYVGLLGHAKVYYTTNINTPRNKWNIQKFSRPNRIFDIPNIEYHLGKLHPDATYFLQIELMIETLTAGPISEIYKVYLPSLPVTTSTTTTTTTSTLPPIIMLDMRLSVEDIDSTTVQVHWRPFTAQEKKFIDGVQIRYRVAGSSSESEHPIEDQNVTETDSDINDYKEDEELWKYSQILHRDNTEYRLEKLSPGRSYVIDLMLISINEINTNIISSKPLMFEKSSSLLSDPKNPYQFDFIIQPTDIKFEMGQIDIELRNLPQPIDKYVHVAKIQYQNTKTFETFYSFASIDQTNRIALSNLLPNNKYKLWIDLFLTNGNIISSNTVDLITNFEKHLFKDKNSGGFLSGIHYRSNESKYLYGLTILSTLMFVTGSIFLIITCFCLRKNHSQTAAALTKVCISDTAAYDNPTYKTFEHSSSNCKPTSNIVVVDYGQQEKSLVTAPELTEDNCSLSSLRENIFQISRQCAKEGI
ncbi:glycogen phosphorylase [Sarcoptes scabiei]|nr:glycogen phosphorylase [Sarcoptes scabiei]